MTATASSTMHVNSVHSQLSGKVLFCDSSHYNLISRITCCHDVPHRNTHKVKTILAKLSPLVIKCFVFGAKLGWEAVKDSWVDPWWCSYCCAFITVLSLARCNLGAINRQIRLFFWQFDIPYHVSSSLSSILWKGCFYGSRPGGLYKTRSMINFDI